MSRIRLAMLGPMIGLVDVLTGCTFSHYEQSHPSAPPGGSLTTSYADTQVFVANECVFAQTSDQRSALAEGILSSAIKIGLNRLGSALRNAGSEKTFTVMRTASVDVSPTRLPGCLYVVTGTFKTDGAALRRSTAGLPLTDPRCELSWAKPITDSIANSGGQAACWSRRLYDAGIYLDGPPDFLYEARIVPSQDRSAIKFETTTLIHQKFIDPSLGTPQGSALVMSIAITDPGAAAPAQDSLGSNAAVTQLAFGKIISPTWRYYTAGGPVSPWLSFDISGTKSSAPRIFFAARTETKDKNEFLLFLADIFDDAKPSIQTSLELMLIDSKRDQAAYDAKKQRNEDTSAAEAKWVEAEKAVGEYKDLPATSALGIRQSKAQVARAAQREANLLASKAKMPPYYQEADLIDIPKK